MKRWLIRELHSKADDMDRRVMMFVVRHINLVLAIGIACLAVWGGISNHPAYIFGLAFVGATAYFSGIISALCVTMLYQASNLAITHAQAFGASSYTFDITVILLQFIGYLAVAFLGFKHKTLREIQRLALKGHQVVPWAVVNEVRTSLSAIRFLLFPLQNEEKPNNEIEQATSELSRLERIFQELEQRDLKK